MMRLSKSQCMEPISTYTKISMLADIVRSSCEISDSRSVSLLQSQFINSCHSQLHDYYYPDSLFSCSNKRMTEFKYSFPIPDNNGSIKPVIRRFHSTHSLNKSELLNLFTKEKELAQLVIHNDDLVREVDDIIYAINHLKSHKDFPQISANKSRKTPKSVIICETRIGPSVISIDTTETTPVMRDNNRFCA